MHKYILMFLSVGAYLAYQKQNMEALASKHVPTPSGGVAPADIHEAHRSKFEELLS